MIKATPGIIKTQKGTDIKAVIFDLGNVLIGFDHYIAVKKILGFTPRSKEEIYNFFFDSTLTQDFERGRISPAAFFKQVKDSLKLKINYKEFLPVWNEIFFSKPDTEKFIKSLDVKLRLVLLSNVNQLHYEYLERKFSGALSLFHKVIPSYMTGYIKPQRQIYALALDACDCSLQNIVYVDDRQDLVSAAEGYGIYSLCFKGIDALRAEFAELGINLTPPRR